MPQSLLILIVEAMTVYFLVLMTHSWRERFGLTYFYGLLGAITAIMSWVTDAGVAVEVGGITFMVGSTVFYTALLLGVFVVYVFDGPRATRIAITTIAGVSIMVPLIALILHFQARLTGSHSLGYVPIPSLRINSASVLTTIADLIFLAVAWEFLGRAKRHLSLYSRTFLTLLGVMWFDVLLFATGAFAGTEHYLSIMQGTLASRLVIATFASPVLYVYLRWQNAKPDVQIEHRPVLAILHEITEVREELHSAQQEIERRIRAEKRSQELIERLQSTLAHVSRLEGLLPICSHCKRIHVDADTVDANSPQQQPRETWISLEEYVRDRTAVKLSHGICEDCMEALYPDMANEIRSARREGSETDAPAS